MKDREKAVLGFTSQGRLFLTRKQSTGGYDLTGAKEKFFEEKYKWCRYRYPLYSTVMS